MWQTVSPHDCHRVKGLGKASLVDELLRDTREPDVCVCVSALKKESGDDNGDTTDWEDCLACVLLTLDMCELCGDGASEKSGAASLQADMLSSADS